MKKMFRIALLTAITIFSFFSLVNVTEARTVCHWINAHYHHGRYIQAHRECWHYRHYYRHCYWKRGHWHHGVWHQAHQRCY